MIRTIHKARYVLVEAGMLHRDVAVHISDPGRISRVEPWRELPPNFEARIVDWGSAILLPGFVNAHTHLELTRLHGLTKSGSVTEWLTQIIQAKRDWTREDFLESAKMGVQLSMAAGTTLLGDISSGGASLEALKAERLRKVVFEEAIAMDPQKSDGAIHDLKARLDCPEPDYSLTFSASPHAPYSVSPELFRAVTKLIGQRNGRLATHVAETRQEVSFLKTGTGEFRDFLESLGALPEGWTAPGLAPIEYLESLGVLDRPAVLVHCNYVDKDSMTRIFSRNCSVVFCPRSHAFFGHEPHPVREMLDMGINVALGTDSLASNDSLSILDEMRFLFSHRKDLKCDEIVRMATLNGAVALGFGGVLGRLRRGYYADMTVLALPAEISERNLTAQILEGAGDCVASVVQGEVSWRSSPNGQ